MEEALDLSSDRLLNNNNKEELEQFPPPPPSTTAFPCRRHSTNAPYSSSSSTCYSYQNDKRAKDGKPESGMLFRKLESDGKESAITLVF